jgi:hypothetical protein
MNNQSAGSECSSEGEGGLKDTLACSQNAPGIILHLPLIKLGPLISKVVRPLLLRGVVGQVLFQPDPCIITEAQDLAVLVRQVLQRLGLIRSIQGRSKKRHKVKHVLIWRHHRGPMVPPAHNHTTQRHKTMSEKQKKNNFFFHVCKTVARGFDGFGGENEKMGPRPHWEEGGGGSLPVLTAMFLELVCNRS